ncbi:MAG: hypothetical protein SP4CHLAM5_02360 [Chlamydiia bacterium]|nr:hypothetical protein [Chlamydiia bacterium]MCH9618110.1 hypothetical protein [Chlamydiia bacterium]MCH9623990.1 hypothetical protein [Chlamydiia bacterium]
MKKVLFLSALIPGLACAALAPLSQSVREITAILSYPSLSDQLSVSSSIEDIKKVSGGYLIITETQAIKVNVEYDKRKRIGAKKFTLYFEAPMPLQQSHWKNHQSSLQ